LKAFEALPSNEQHEVVAEILRRFGEYGDLLVDAYDALAAEIFRGYDAEETARP
jgi:hypothetical protein